MSERPNCKKCSRPIMGIIKIDTSRRKLGNKSLNQVDYYDEDCYYKRNQEQAINEYQKERLNKKKNKR